MVHLINRDKETNNNFNEELVLNNCNSVKYICSFFFVIIFTNIY